MPMDSESLATQLARWEQTGTAENFPYEAILSFYRTRGKHFVPASTLATLAAIRERLAMPVNARAEGGDPVGADDGSSGADDADSTLRKFLDVALDKWDGTYNYHTYLGLGLLDVMPDANGRTDKLQHDEWVRILLADALAFERDARDGRQHSLPLMRPSQELADKRIRLLDGIVGHGEVRAKTSRGHDDTASSSQCRASARMQRALSLSMQPVYIVHDEYLFIRILQSFEVTFAAMASEIRD